MLHKYYEPLKARLATEPPNSVFARDVKESTLNEIFGKVRVIIPLSQQLLELLEPKIDSTFLPPQTSYRCRTSILTCSLSLSLSDSHLARDADWSDTTVIGDVFISMTPFLKMYNQYTNNYDTALNTFMRITKNPVRLLSEIAAVVVWFVVRLLPFR